LGGRLALPDAQVRKDWLILAILATRASGYRCDELIVAIRKILGTRPAMVGGAVGAGNLSLAAFVGL